MVVLGLNVCVFAHFYTLAYFCIHWLPCILVHTFCLSYHVSLPQSQEPALEHKEILIPYGIDWCCNFYHCYSKVKLLKLYSLKCTVFHWIREECQKICKHAHTEGGGGQGVTSLRSHLLRVFFFMLKTYLIGSRGYLLDIIL